MELVLLKVIFLISIYFVCLLCCCLPLKLIPKKGTADYVSTMSQKILSYSNCFAGGVFLGVCFIGLIPTVTDKFSDLLRSRSVESHYPVAELTIILGFFIIIFIEQLVTSCQEKHKHDEHVELSVMRVDDQTSVSDGAIVDRSFLDIQNDSVASDAEICSEEQHPLANSATEDHGNHGHSHNMSNTILAEGSIRNYILLLALSIHSVFEGMALGLQETMAQSIDLFIAVIIHESLVFVAMGVSIAKLNVSFRAGIQIAMILSLMIPAGVGLGIGVGNVQGVAGDLASAILQGVAAGTFIYVIFLEVLPKEIGHHNNDLLKLLLVFVGFMMIALLQFMHV